MLSVVMLNVIVLSVVAPYILPKSSMARELVTGKHFQLNTLKHDRYNEKIIGATTLDKTIFRIMTLSINNIQHNNIQHKHLKSKYHYAKCRFFYFHAECRCAEYLCWVSLC